jgi:2-dehydro-3-deoxyglucarate aldolase
MTRLAWQQIPSPIVSELLCHTNLDGIVIDTEHAAFNNETIHNCIQTITSLGKKCFVRLMVPTKSSIRMCLDSGATGLIFSTIENAKQCEKIMNCCKYPKFGGRRGLGLVRANKWGLSTLITDPPIVIAQIETISAINNLEDILKYNFDHYMIGPYDLSASLGVPGDFTSALYLDAIKKMEDMIPKNKMAVHIPTEVKKYLKKYEDYGIMALGMDTTGLLEFYTELEDK